MISIAVIATYIAVAASLAALWLAVQIRSMLAAWNVRQAWTWMIVALLALLMHSIVRIPQVHCSDAVVSAAAYFAATMLLTPLVTILGARRPGISAWHWFVVLPMVLVLQWPAISQLLGNHWRAPIELSAPSMMGIVVVLMMSAGTFFGTRATVFAMLYSAGIVIQLMSVTSLTSGKTVTIGPLSSVLVLMSLWMTRRNLLNELQKIQNGGTASQRTQAVWALFSSLHGFAWMRRAQDRINQFGLREHWMVHLTTAGFQHSEAAVDREPNDDELLLPLQAFTWVLARFADESWLRQTLHNPQIPRDLSNTTH